MDFEIPTGGISFEELEMELIIKAMEKANWVIAGAAHLLGMSYKTLQYRLNKFDIKKGVHKRPTNTPNEAGDASNRLKRHSI